MQIDLGRVTHLSLRTHIYWHLLQEDMRNLNACLDRDDNVIGVAYLREGCMFEMRKNVSGLVCDHQAPTPEPVEEPGLPERLPEPADEPPVPDHNPSSAWV